MDITVTKRAPQTKGERKRRLRQGYVPGALYGRSIPPQTIEVSAKAIADVLLSEAGRNTVLQLKIDGESKRHTVLIDNLERDPITRGFRNVGFHEVKRGDKVTAQIPIQLSGEPAEVATSDALLEQTLTEIDVRAQPTDLPPHLEVDVSHMKIGDVLRVSDLPHDPKLEFLTAEDTTIVSMHVARVAAEPETVVEALTGEDAVTELRADEDRESDSVTGTANP